MIDISVGPSAFQRSISPETELLTLQTSGGCQRLVDVGGQERLQTGACLHVHAGTDVQVSMHKEGETTEKATPGTETRYIIHKNTALHNEPKSSSINCDCY